VALGKGPIRGRKYEIELVVAVLFACTPALAGSEKIKFPSDYLKGVLYQTVDRHDINRKGVIEVK
jgi:hypothetical protein